MTRSFRFTWKTVIIIIASLFFVGVRGTMENHQQLTQIEIDLEEFIMGFRIASCGYNPWNPAMDYGFRATFAEIANQFCANLTLCNLKSLNGSTFSDENVVILENYPKWDFTAVKVRFVFIYPLRTVYLTKQFRPLMQKHVMSIIMGRTLEKLSREHGWQVLDFERTPRYDPITEFMNIAVLPIIVLIIILMFALATWSSKFSSRTEGGGGTWMVKGVSGGKNTAVRRIQEIIDEDNVKSSITASRRFKEDKNNAVLLNVVKLQQDFEHAKDGRQSSSANVPQITVTSAAADRIGILKRQASRRGDSPPGEQRQLSPPTPVERKERRASADSFTGGGKRRQSAVTEAGLASDYGKHRRSRASVNFQQQLMQQSGQQRKSWMSNNIVLRGLQKRKAPPTNKL